MKDKRFYTGVGSRFTPVEMRTVLNDIAYNLASDGWILRSGAADGADTAFEKGCISIKGKMNIYLPWDGFNNRKADGKKYILPDESWPVYERAQELVEQIHPNYGVLSQGAIRLHTRNIFQSLGDNIDTPSKFLVCWANVDKDGFPVGGTRTAWTLARMNRIPCFNLFIEKDMERINKWLQK